ncbi:ABC transporter ATP-binding protein [Streptomyces sp. CA-278952]|uniref:ABC transporter ATP-binding protein n=1 Tax=Streptomyces sp. CA-278952 TaxID=2980556 RepID=UPI002367C78A|nr:ABC transporter ATP-binding protein [Streptomyces sp. CA-278952]WDG29677.1 ABC transporter ATP-binding protein [Streptomyces sp. CA-278952]
MNPVASPGQVPAVRLRSVTRSYGSGGRDGSAVRGGRGVRDGREGGGDGGDGRTVKALDDVSLTIHRGTFTAVMGPSGSGKSTLLHCVAGLDRPTGGRVLLGDTDLTGLSEARLTRLRRGRIGFVFQAFNLLPSLTAAQNVALPLRLAGRRPRKAEVLHALDQVGLRDRAGHRPGELSGGQQQRVAIARALVTRPEVLFGDEPTGALDSTAGRVVLGLLRAMTDEGRTVIMVTHDPVAASFADRVVFLADGRVRDELDAPTAERVAARMAAGAAPTAPMLCSGPAVVPC